MVKKISQKFGHYVFIYCHHRLQLSYIGNRVIFLLEWINFQKKKIK